VPPSFQNHPPHTMSPSTQDGSESKWKLGSLSSDTYRMRARRPLVSSHDRIGTQGIRMPGMDLRRTTTPSTTGSILSNGYSYLKARAFLRAYAYGIRTSAKDGNRGVVANFAKVTVPKNNLSTAHSLTCQGSNVHCRALCFRSSLAII
jgi:hypothetical protein